MSDYQYQHDVFFQYSFGSTAFLLYLTAVNLADLRPQLARIIPAAVAATICLGVFSANIVPKVREMDKLYREYKPYYQGIDQALDKIPDDASVCANTFYIVPLSQRKELYDLRYCTKEQLLSSEYVVVKSNSDSEFKAYEGGYDHFHKNLIAQGYEVFHKQGSLVIYRKTHATK